MNEARLFFGLITVNYMSEAWGDVRGYQPPQSSDGHVIYSAQNTVLYLTDW